MYCVPRETPNRIDMSNARLASIDSRPLYASRPARRAIATGARETLGRVREHPRIAPSQRVHIVEEIEKLLTSWDDPGTAASLDRADAQARRLLRHFELRKAT